MHKFTKTVQKVEGFKVCEPVTVFSGEAVRSVLTAKGSSERLFFIERDGKRFVVNQKTMEVTEATCWGYGKTRAEMHLVSPGLESVLIPFNGGSFGYEIGRRREQRKFRRFILTETSGFKYAINAKEKTQHPELLTLSCEKGWMAIADFDQLGSFSSYDEMEEALKSLSSWRTTFQDQNSSHKEHPGSLVVRSMSGKCKVFLLFNGPGRLYNASRGISGGATQADAIRALQYYFKGTAFEELYDKEAATHTFLNKKLLIAIKAWLQPTLEDGVWSKEPGYLHCPSKEKDLSTEYISSPGNIIGYPDQPETKPFIFKIRYKDELPEFITKTYTKTALEFVKLLLSLPKKEFLVSYGLPILNIQASLNLKDHSSVSQYIERMVRLGHLEANEEVNSTFRPVNSEGKRLRGKRVFALHYRPAGEFRAFIEELLAREVPRSEKKLPEASDMVIAAGSWNHELWKLTNYFFSKGEYLEYVSAIHGCTEERLELALSAWSSHDSRMS